MGCSLLLHGAHWLKDDAPLLRCKGEDSRALQSMALAPSAKQLQLPEGGDFGRLRGRGEGAGYGLTEFMEF